MSASSLYKKTRSNPITVIIGILILLTLALLVIRLFSSDDLQVSGVDTTTQPTTVEIIDISEASASSRYASDGVVISGARSSLTAEAAGLVRNVNVELGDNVARGQVLLSLSAEDERASLAQAEANLLAQQARLSELLAGSLPAEIENTSLSAQTARNNLETAKTNLFNTDLRAYVENEDIYVLRGNLQPPIISGYYQGEEEGEYVIDLYQSNSKSGYSFTYSGLENGTEQVSTEIPQPLGDRGLYILFPENFAKTFNLEWVVPVPNTRSAQYPQALSNVESARLSLSQAANNLLLTAQGPRSEQILAQEAAVAQASAGVQSAQARLNKKTLRAPFSGTISSIDANQGELVSPGNILIDLVDREQLSVTTFVSGEVASSLRAGDSVLISNSYGGEIIAISPAIDSGTGKVEVEILITDNSPLIVGEYVSLDISSSTQTGSRVSVPLSAVKNDTRGSYVLTIEEGTATRVDVETGRISGERIILTSIPESISNIITNAGDVSIGDQVTRQ